MKFLSQLVFLSLLTLIIPNSQIYAGQNCDESFALKDKISEEDKNFGDAAAV